MTDTSAAPLSYSRAASDLGSGVTNVGKGTAELAAVATRDAVRFIGHSVAAAGAVVFNSGAVTAVESGARELISSRPARFGFAAAGLVGFAASAVVVYGKVRNRPRRPQLELIVNEEAADEEPTTEHVTGWVNG